MSAEGHESLQETVQLLSTRANAVHILCGLAEAREGAAQPAGLQELPPGSACRQTSEDLDYFRPSKTSSPDGLSSLKLWPRSSGLSRRQAQVADRHWQPRTPPIPRR
jgi:hypothetical protein